MAIYLWLDFSLKMLKFETHESFQRAISGCVLADLHNNTENIFVEKNTPQWDD